MNRRHLSSVITIPEPAGWFGRLAVAEALQLAGWEVENDGQAMRKNGAIWTLADDDDTSFLICPDNVVIRFSVKAKTVIVVATCMAAADTV